MVRGDEHREAWDGERFRGVIETLVDGVIIIDARGTVQLYNPACARIFGYASEEVLGHNVNMLMPTPYREEHDDYLERYRRTGERRIIGIGREVVGRRKDGSTFPMDLSVGEILQDGQAAYVGIIRDITERNEALHRVAELQAELIHVSRLGAMGAMGSTLAHELNQPLTAITNYVEAARRMLQEPERFSAQRVSDALSKASEQAHRAGEIIRRLREFVRKGETDRALVDIDEVLREAGPLLLIGTKAQGITLRLDLGAAERLVLIDAVQVQQVVLNLVRNAVEAMQDSEQRQLIIATGPAEAEGFLEVRVTDSGPGLDPAVEERLFQPFVTTKASGTGIGLSISRSIVEAHGGQLGLRRHQDAAGVTFYFTLPLAQSK